MSWREFFSQLVDSLAVPGAVLAACLIFRRPLARVLAAVAEKIEKSGSLRKMHGGPGGVHLEFDPDKTATWTEEYTAPLDELE